MTRKSINGYLNQIREYGSIFNKYNLEDWSRLRNRLDFDTIYDESFPELERVAFESIYKDGRDISVNMSTILLDWDCYQEDGCWIHDVVPKKIAESLIGNCWIENIELLKENLEVSTILYEKTIDISPNAIKAMLELYEEQLGLLSEINVLLEDFYNAV